MQRLTHEPKFSFAANYSRVGRVEDPTYGTFASDGVSGRGPDLRHYDTLTCGGMSGRGPDLRNFDDGGDPDRAAAGMFNDRVSVLRNLGDGTHDPPVHFGTGGGPFGVTFGDLAEGLCRPRRHRV